MRAQPPSARRRGVPRWLRPALGPLWLALALGPAAGPAGAGDNPATPPVAGPCDSAGHRQFDFWLGDWDVRSAQGRLVGHNRISATYGGCVLQEHYETPRGYRGESLNAYDPGRRQWHQTWVDNAGMLLRLDGGWDAGHMRLSGQTVDAQGQVTRHRITWTPLPDGSVRQHWETAAQAPAAAASMPAPAAWRTVFDGHYTRRSPR